MDGYMKLFFFTGEPVFFVASKREGDAARS